MKISDTGQNLSVYNDYPSFIENIKTQLQEIEEKQEARVQKNRLQIIQNYHSSNNCSNSSATHANSISTSNR